MRGFQPWLTAFVGAACLSLPACSSVNSDSEVKSATIASLPPLPERWLVEGAQPGDIQIGWIDKTGDPLLSQLVREAQANNRDIRAASANVEAARAQVKQARSALFPSVNLAASGQRQGLSRDILTQSVGPIAGPIPDQNEFALVLEAQWEADLWGRVRAGRNAAYASAQAVETDFRFAQYSLAAAVASAYFASIEAQLQIDVAERTVVALAQIDRIVAVRYREGFASAQETAIAASDLATARDGLAAAEGSARAARRALEVLLGRYPAEQIELRTGFPETPAAPPAGLPAQLLERRPDLIAAERRVAAAFAGLDQAKAARLPIVNLTSNVGGVSNEFGRVLNGSNLIWSIVGSVLQPIFDGGLRKAAVDEADANQRAAIEAYATTALGAFSEVENNLDQFAVLKVRVAQLKLAAAEADRAYGLSELRYKEGETDLIDVLSVQQRVFTTQRNLVALQRSQIDQWVAFNLALGGDWSEVGGEE